MLFISLLVLEAICKYAVWRLLSANSIIRQRMKNGNIATLPSPRGRLAKCACWHLWSVADFKWPQFETEVVLLAVVLKIDANCSLSARWQDFGPFPKIDVLRHNNA